MSVRRGRPYSARALAARRRAAALSGTIKAELEAAHYELERAPRWRWMRRRALRAHEAELGALWHAYMAGARDSIVAKAKVEAGWKPPGVVILPRGSRLS